MIENVKIGWKRLADILNNIIIKNLNLQKPIQGDGVSLSETASGTIISVLHRGDDSNDPSQSGNGGGGGGQGGQWITITVYDTNCNPSTIQVWGIPGG